MKTVTYAVVGAVVVGVAAFGGAPSPSAAAQGNPYLPGHASTRSPGTTLAAGGGTTLPSGRGTPGYDIETSRMYCANGASSCFDPASIQYLRYAQATVFSTGGTAPVATVLVCAKHYYAADGLHALALHVFAGPTQAGFDGGTPFGAGYTPFTASENDTAVYSQFYVTGSDPVLGTSGSAMTHSSATSPYFGPMGTDNVADQTIYGGAQISITGWFDDIDFSNGQDTPHAAYGSLSCWTGGPNPNLGTDTGSEALAGANSDTDGD
ncbi:MAG: hypothetical protein JOZ41_10105 [Chloroflexi bacterium]|nr:hypothetical protein [Chloroflexota bacterium]